MNDSITLMLLLAAIACTSYLGGRSPDFTARWLFDAERIRLRREYYRLVTSCGLHADVKHFAFNAFTIYCFGSGIAFFQGDPWMLIIFFGTVLTGSLFSYALYRKEHYQALGASGGACGLIFAYILFFPGASVSLGFIPIYIPGWLYAVIFVVTSYIAFRRKSDNIGHCAHLGGAAGGILLAALHSPRVLVDAPWTTWLAIGCLAVVCVYLALWPHGFKKRVLTEDIDAYNSNLRYQRYDENARTAADRRRMDALLDKISRHGANGLSAREQHELNELSKQRETRRR
jgi:membrane associated rhomboid family serine protease